MLQKMLNESLTAVIQHRDHWDDERFQPVWGDERIPEALNILRSSVKLILNNPWENPAAVVEIQKLFSCGKT